MRMILRVCRIVKDGTENAMLSAVSMAIIPIFGAEKAE
jgi:hypothetical protein